MEKIINTTPEKFDSDIAQGVVLLDFWASWCNPCKMLGKILEQTAPLLPKGSRIVKAEIGECPEQAAAYAVDTVPQLILFKDGVQLKRFPAGKILTRPEILKSILAD